MDRLTPTQALESLEQLLVQGNDDPGELQKIFGEQSRARSGCPSSDTQGLDGVSVTPEQGFVVKTTDTSGGKVFINVCGSSSVPLPGDWPEGPVPTDVQEALENAEGAVDVVRLPLSMGPPRDDLDHNKESCTTMDCIFNIDILKQAESYRKLKLLLIDLALNWAIEKNGISLSHEYKLPRMRYKGTVIPQVVRQHKRPVVREVKDVPEPPQIPLGFLSQQKTQQPGTSAAAPPIEPKREQPAIVFSFDRSKGNQQSQAQLESNQLLGPSISGSKECHLSYEIYQEGRPVHTVWVTVSSPAGVSLEETSVKVNGDQLLATSHLHGPLAVALPFGVAASQASGQLTEDGTLRLTLPYAPLREWIS